MVDIDHIKNSCTTWHYPARLHSFDLLFSCMVCILQGQGEVRFKSKGRILLHPCCGTVACVVLLVGVSDCADTAAVCDLRANKTRRNSDIVSRSVGRLFMESLEVR